MYTFRTLYVGFSNFLWIFRCQIFACKATVSMLCAHISNKQWFSAIRTESCWTLGERANFPSTHRAFSVHEFHSWVVAEGGEYGFMNFRKLSSTKHTETTSFHIMAPTSFAYLCHHCSTKPVIVIGEPDWTKPP